MAQTASMQELRKCSAVPNFVHMFNVLHADYLSLPKLDIDEYEYSLLPAETKHPDDIHDPTVLPNIIIKLLKGCGQAYVREDTCFDILRSLALRKWHIFANCNLPCPFISPLETAETEPEASFINQSPEPVLLDSDHNSALVEPSAPVDLLELPNISDHNPASEIVRIQETPVKQDAGCDVAIGQFVDPPFVQFDTLAPALKAETLLLLLNSWMMGYLIKTNFIDNIEPSLLRIIPCGNDQKGNNFFYFFGTRLYKESNARYDQLTGTGSFDWELVASDIEGFQEVLADLKKSGMAGKNKNLINFLETKIIPNLPAAFEEKHQNDLQKKMEFRRRRSTLLRQAKEKTRLERQETAAVKNSKKMKFENEKIKKEHFSWSEKRQLTAVSRAERYKRRLEFFKNEEVSVNTSKSGRHLRQKHNKGQKIPEIKENLMEKAGRLLLDWFTSQTLQWPSL